MQLTLQLASGALWTITYVLIIQRGFADRTYGMPLVALGANVSWEFIFSFLYPSAIPQRAVNIVWLIFDLVIVYTVLRFGPREFPGIPRMVFYAGFALTLATAFGAVLLISQELDSRRGVYAAFGQNLLMSSLFIAMLLSRRSLAGQSAGIAFTKLAGTACASVSMYLYAPEYAGSRLLPFLYLAILVFDAIYFAAVIIMSRVREPRAVARAG